MVESKGDEEKLKHQSSAQGVAVGATLSLKSLQSPSHMTNNLCALYNSLLYIGKDNFYHIAFDYDTDFHEKGGDQDGKEDTNDRGMRSSTAIEGRFTSPPRKTSNPKNSVSITSLSSSSGTSSALSSSKLMEAKFMNLNDTYYILVTSTNGIELCNREGTRIISYLTLEEILDPAYLIIDNNNNGVGSNKEISRQREMFRKAYNNLYDKKVKNINNSLSPRGEKDGKKDSFEFVQGISAISSDSILLVGTSFGTIAVVEMDAQLQQLKMMASFSFTNIYGTRRARAQANIFNDSEVHCGISNLTIPEKDRIFGAKDKGEDNEDDDEKEYSHIMGADNDGRIILYQYEYPLSKSRLQTDKGYYQKEEDFDNSDESDEEAEMQKKQRLYSGTLCYAGSTKKTGVPITAIAAIRSVIRDKTMEKEEKKPSQYYTIFSSNILGQILIHRAVFASNNQSSRSKDFISIHLFASLTGHVRCINSLTLHPYLPLLLTAGDDGCVCLWHYKKKIEKGMSSMVQDSKSEDLVDTNEETRRTLTFLSATQALNHQIVGAQFIINQRRNTRRVQDANQIENLHVAISSYDTESIQFWTPRLALES